MNTHNISKYTIIDISDDDFQNHINIMNNYNIVFDNDDLLQLNSLRVIFGYVNNLKQKLTLREEYINKELKFIKNFTGLYVVNGFFISTIIGFSALVLTIKSLIT